MQTMTTEKISEVKQPTRDELNEKILHEAKAVFDVATEDDLTSFHSEVEVKHKIRNELLGIYMTDEMVHALHTTDNVLDDAYKLYLELDYEEHVHLAVLEYLDKAERRYLADRVYDRVKSEYDSCVDDIKQMPPEKIVEEMYILTTLYDIHISLDPESSSFSVEQLKALLTLEAPLLWNLYNEWMRRDWTYMDQLKATIIDVANCCASEHTDCSSYAEHGNFDGLEP